MKLISGGFNYRVKIADQHIHRLEVETTSKIRSIHLFCYPPSQGGAMSRALNALGSANISGRGQRFRQAMSLDTELTFQMCYLDCSKLSGRTQVKLSRHCYCR